MTAWPIQLLDDSGISRFQGEAVGTPNGGSQAITSPLQIADCALWLDASTLALSDGAPVTLWPDGSPSGTDAAQAVADNQPVYKTAIQNGLGVVRCDPAVHDQFLALSGAGLDLLRNVDGATVAFVAARAANPPGANGLISVSDGIDNTNFRLYLELQGITVPQFSNEDGTSGLFAPGSIALTNNSAGGVLPPLAGVAAVDFVQGMVAFDTAYNGSASNGDTSGATLGATSDTASNSIEIGRLADLSGPMDGDLCEIVVYQRALNASERRQLREYLSAKWAVL